jgi:hypothetical protein
MLVFLLTANVWDKRSVLFGEVDPGLQGCEYCVAVEHICFFEEIACIFCLRDVKRSCVSGDCHTEIAGDRTVVRSFKTRKKSAFEGEAILSVGEGDDDVVYPPQDLNSFRAIFVDTTVITFAVVDRGKTLSFNPLFESVCPTTRADSEAIQGFCEAPDFIRR